MGFEGLCKDIHDDLCRYVDISIHIYRWGYTTG